MRRVLALSTALLALAAPGVAHASGVTTHAFMAEAAIPFVGNAQLRTLLEANADAVVTGAHYPDGGYAVSSLPGGNYGEVSHWERFVNAYAAQLRARTDCGNLADPAGPCAESIAFLMGIAGHGIGDERWDWLFEPKMADFGESPVHPGYRAMYAAGLPGAAELASLPPGQFINTPEFAMDNIALIEWDRLKRLPITSPPMDDLMGAYERRGNTEGVTPVGIRAGQTAIVAAALGERAGVAAEYPRVKLTMPTVSAQYRTGSGGVLDVAQAAAPYYEAVWAKIHGEHPTPRVTRPHPEPGETGVPISWHPVRSSPGPNGGGSENRILASLSTQLDGSSINARSFRLLGPDGAELEQEAGFPRPGPYGTGDGNHTLMAWPKHDLEPCTTYTAELTTALRDHAGNSLPEPFRWSFTTRSADGAACPTTLAAPLAGAGPQQVPTVVAPDGHDHGLPSAPTVAIRSLQRSAPGRVAVTLTCVGPGACRGRLALLGTTHRGAMLNLGSVDYAIPALRTEVLSFAPVAAAATALLSGGSLQVEARAVQRTATNAIGSTTTRTFTLSGR